MREAWRRFKCRWTVGHKIKAEFIAVGGRFSWRYWCERCKAPLPGPRP